MSGLNIPTDGNASDTLPTIADVSLDAISSRVAPRQVASGVTRGIQQLGSDKVYSDGGNQQIIVADTVPRVLMGNQTSFGEGFYVSKSGIDATTNTDASKWIFNSNQNVYKIVKTVTLNLSVVSTGTNGFNTTSLAHGLTFTPSYEAKITLDPTIASLSVSPQANYVSPALTYGVVAGAIRILSISAVSIDAVNVNFETQLGNTAAGTYNFVAIVDLKQQTFTGS